MLREYYEISRSRWLVQSEVSAFRVEPPSDNSQIVGNSEAIPVRLPPRPARQFNVF
jgi:hypothetical protein